MASNTSLSCIVPECLAGTMLGLALAPASATFLISPLLSAMVFKAFGFQVVAGVAFASLVSMQALVAGLEYVIEETKEEKYDSGASSSGLC